ncbi:hypothetical protein ACPV5S_15715 [Vibrio astriarenae]
MNTLKFKNLTKEVIHIVDMKKGYACRFEPNEIKEVPEQYSQLVASHGVALLATPEQVDAEDDVNPEPSEDELTPAQKGARTKAMKKAMQEAEASPDAAE